MRPKEDPGVKSYIPIENAREKVDAYGQQIDILTGKMKDLEKNTRQVDEKSKLIGERLKQVHWLMAVIIVVLFVAVIGFVLDYRQFQAESFTDLKDSVDALRDETNDKNYEIFLMKIKLMEEEINDLKEGDKDNND